MKSTIAAALLVMPLAPLSAQEQAPDTARVNPVVITATRTPLARNALPVAVTIISADELRIRGITTVADALIDISGAYVAQAGSQGATTSLFLRGGESKYVKVLIDGIPANDPGGAYDFASLTTDNVERIEVVRGPASVIHGADAVTGVVNVITRRGTGTPTGELRVSGGIAPRARVGSSPAPDGTRHYDASVSLAGAPVDALSYALSLARHQSGGLYELNNAYQNNVLSGRVDFGARANTDVRVNVRYTDYQYNYPTDGGGNVVDNNAFRVDDRIALGVQVDHRLRDAARAVLAVSSSVNEGGTDDGVDDATDGSSFVSQDRVRRRGAELRLHLTPSIGAFTVGAQLEQQDQRSQSQSMSPFGPFLSEFRAARRNVAGYGEAVLTMLPALTATVGARVDDNEAFGTFGTGRAGLSWRALPSTRLRVTVGNAFREPSFAENYSTGFVVGNPDLKPERTTTWDGGIDHELLNGRARASASAFAQRFVNMIDYEGTGAACGYSYCNVAEATSNGIEVEGAARIWGPVHASMSATFLRTRVVEPGFDNTSGGLYQRGEALIRRPERKVTGDLSYRGNGPLSASLRILAVGIRTDRDFRTFPATPVVLGSYERLDLGAEYALTSRHTANVRIENLTDVRYENVFNFLTPRRTISLGFRSSF